MASPRIVVVGAGGVGGPFGTALALGGADVTFIARGDHLKAIQDQGLRIDGARGSFLLQPAQATDDPESVGPADYVIFTPKLWDVETTGAFIKPLVGRDTAVIPIQNGIDAAERLAPILGEGRVMGGVAVINAVIDGPGRIRQMGSFQHFTFGELDGSITPRAERLKAVCDSSGLDATLSDDITKALWEKFVFLVGVSSLTGATRQWTGVSRNDPDLRQVLRNVMAEVTAVGQACGVALADDTPEQKLGLIDSQDGRSISSMAVDLLRGNKLELPWLAGKVVELGKEKGVPTPTTYVLFSVLKPYIHGRPEDSPTG
ncbi:MAG TPA: 2-dehydropantoate 2-reductase [Alphaproteobacteria bacterium]|nr:2-dehydropantoate 2-reductase [Alphaproteobacteria bacterium]